MIWLLKYWKPIAVAALLVLVFSLGYGTGASREAMKCANDLLMAQSAQSEALAAANAQTLATERAAAAALAVIGEQYERDKTHAQAVAAAVIADLAAGNSQLLAHWQGCQATGNLSGAAASASQLAESARLRAESAGRVIAAGAEADAQVRGLQAVTQADRK